MATKKKTLVDKMKEKAAKREPTKRADGEQHFGDGEHSRIAKKRIDCYVTEEEYRKLIILGAQSSPVRKPNKFAEFHLRNVIASMSIDSTKKG